MAMACPQFRRNLTVVIRHMALNLMECRPGTEVTWVEHNLHQQVETPATTIQRGNVETHLATEERPVRMLTRQQDDPRRSAHVRCIGPPPAAKRVAGGSLPRQRSVLDGLGRRAAEPHALKARVWKLSRCNSLFRMNDEHARNAERQARARAPIDAYR
mmetsp:Transcript_20565/g.38679  ORF Transcript_20565/g.38679 Transcript_20565/m.38679 type:complete len:158 (-) Transcript_20565:86-559(-)